MAFKPTEARKDIGSVYFIDIPKVGQPVSNNTLVVSQKRATFVNGVQVEGESTDMISSNGQGLYTLPKNHPNHAARVTALEVKMARENTGEIPVLLGPFDTALEAFSKMDEVREKSPEEAKNIALKKLATVETEKAEQLAELAELRNKLAALQKKQAKDQ